MFRANKAFKRDEIKLRCTLDIPEELSHLRQPDNFPLFVVQTDSTTLVLMANDSDRRLGAVDIAMLLDSWATAMIGRFGEEAMQAAMMIAQSGVLGTLNPNDN